MSHRIRHHCARGVGLFQKNSLCSYAGTVAEMNDSAVLGTVATHPAVQRKGFGSLMVSVLTQKLVEEGKQVFLFRSLEENDHFYQRLGFSDIGKWEESLV